MDKTKFIRLYDPQGALYFYLGDLKQVQFGLTQLKNANNDTADKSAWMELDETLCSIEKAVKQIEFDS